MSTQVDPAVQGGNYEVIRARLQASGRVLVERAAALNEQRKAKFGGTELTILANERARTENACLPRDVAQVEGRLLVGFNVANFLRKTTPEDVLQLYDVQATEAGFELTPLPHDQVAWLKDRSFVREFDKLVEFYKDARLQQLRRTSEGRLLAVFRVGARESDLKVFRWSLDARGAPTYLDDRGEREVLPAEIPAIDWRAPAREDYVLGRHPHISILGEVFIETVGGDLTVKIENNTEDGQGIYREPVEDAKQSLDDAAIHYAKLGPLILLRVLPFREKHTRYLVFNTTTRSVARIDALGQACIPLEDGHGLIFPGGYYLRTGEHKLFDGDSSGLSFFRQVRAPNGEDTLYIFYRPSDGLYWLFPYNKIRQEVQSPIGCHGWSLFDDGRLVLFRGVGSEPVKVHPMQMWRTPFCTPEHAAAQPSDGSLLSRIGNAELVRGLSDVNSLARLIDNPEPSRQVFEDIASSCTRMLDGHHWLSDASLGNLAETAREIRRTAELIIDEFEKVQTLRGAARKALLKLESEHVALLRENQPEGWREVQPFLDAMARLRRHRGVLITARDTRYIDTARLDALEKETIAAFEHVSRSCVSFLLGGEAFTPLVKQLDELSGRIDKIDRSQDLEPITAELDRTGEGLNLLAEVVGGLEVGDAQARTSILEGIAEVFSQLNRVRAVLSGRHRELVARENRATFGAQIKLLSQSVANALTVADSPERCDELLSRLLLQIEEMEGRFGEIEELLPELAARREEVYEALSSRKQALVEARQRRIQSIVDAAGRILEGVNRRTKSFKAEDELQGYFASDAMVLKLRQLSEQLAGLGDSVKSEELLSRLKSARQDALRGLRDKSELFDGGDNLIRFGKHRFTVNTQPLDLTLVPRDGGLALHLSGTDFYEKIEDPELEATRVWWDQPVPSESPTVYRGEYLAASVLFAAEQSQSVAQLTAAQIEAGGLLKLVRAYAAERYDEGYERGLHDADAALILDRLLTMRSTAGLLRFPASCRAMAAVYWAETPEGPAKLARSRQARSLGRLRRHADCSEAIAALCATLASSIQATVAGIFEFNESQLRMAAEYLFEELQAERPRFVLSAAAEALRSTLERHLDDHGSRAELDEDLRALEGQLGERVALLRAWLRGVAGESWALDEAVARLLAERKLDFEPTTAQSEGVVEGLLGQHPRIVERKLSLRLDELLVRLSEHERGFVAGWRRFRELRHRILERERRRLRLGELMPKVMSTFVRNKLINDVYLPVVGDNLAKQIGAAGEGKRTDLMGMLLLVSPPGYGKTTLMEYLAARLGLVFMKINGPALGHGVRSLDPAEAPNATSRQEVEKINLALEMGNNVMLYLDDIQHTHPELLQKFISLCDAQRRIEGVWKGHTRTYDLRGKKFCVVMAGNPYTESGDKFVIPDMLANRADTYNLGEVLDGREETFALSYVENALTSNAVLAPLAARSQDDVYKLVRMARGEEIASTELAHEYSAVELGEIKAVLNRLFQVQRVVLAVNRQYVASAAQSDAFRDEPPFKLQGSYRNMNKLAEKVVSAMTPEEVERLLDDHYAGESQTLTSGAEQNLLKLAELRGRMSEEQAQRWAAIRQEFRRLRSMGGKTDDPVARVTGVLATLGQQVEGVGAAVKEGRGVEATLSGLGERLEQLAERIAASVTDGQRAARKEHAEGLLGVRQAIASGAGLEDEVKLVADRIGLLAKTIDASARQPSPLAQPLEVIQTRLSDETAGMREGLASIVNMLDAVRAELASGARPGGYAAPPMTSTPDPLAVLTLAQASGGGRRKSQRDLLLTAQRTLRGDEAPEDPERSAAMAASVRVIQSLVVRMTELATQYLTPAERDPFLDDLRRHVALSLSELGEG